MISMQKQRIGTLRAQGWGYKAIAKDLGLTENCVKKAWWHSHPNSISRKAIYAFPCPACGNQFSAYGNARRKFCSHAYYIESRFSAKAGAAHDVRAAPKMLYGRFPDEKAKEK